MVRELCFTDRVAHGMSARASVLLHSVRISYPVPECNTYHVHRSDLFARSAYLAPSSVAADTPTADFSMIDWKHGLNGSSDRWRCVSRTGCLLEEYLRASRHLDNNEDRTTEVVSEQWHMAIWTFAAWAISYGRSRIAFFDGEAYMSCPVCKILVSLSSGDALTTGVAHCTNAQCSPQPLPLYVLHRIAKTPFDGALNAARTACGGVRGYPLLRGMSSRLQFRTGGRIARRGCGWWGPSIAASSPSAASSRAASGPPRGASCPGADRNRRNGAGARRGGRGAEKAAARGCSAVPKSAGGPVTRDLCQERPSACFGSPTTADVALPQPMGEL